MKASTTLALLITCLAGSALAAPGGEGADLAPRDDAADTTLLPLDRRDEDVGELEDRDAEDVQIEARVPNKAGAKKAGGKKTGGKKTGGRKNGGKKNGGKKNGGKKTGGRKKGGRKNGGRKKGGAKKAKAAGAA